MTVRLSVQHIEASSLSAVAKWCPQTHETKLSFLPTFLNHVRKEDNVYEAMEGPRLLTTDRGYSYGAATITLRLGAEPVEGVGVCCRPGSDATGW